MSWSDTVDYGRGHCFDIADLRVTVIVAPGSIVSSGDAKDTKVFSDDDSDDYVQLLLDVAQSQIDGLNGWLGRSIGLQTLQAVVPSGINIDTTRLPLQPYVEMVSSTDNDDGTCTLQWRAGYGAAPAQPLPAAIKHAIILMAGVLRDATPDEGGAVKRQTVEGVGIFDFGLPDGGATAMKAAAESLLGPYKVLRL